MDKELDSDCLISRLKFQFNREVFEEFKRKNQKNFELDPSLRMLYEKARVCQEIIDIKGWEFLFIYFEKRRILYPALCCAEAIILEKNNWKFYEKYQSLLLEYNNRKKKEIKALKDVFLKNKPEVSISVIMPTYNRPYKIKKAIESVLNQTFTDFELIIINDGGSIECEKTINSFNSEKIRYKYIDHKGLSNALNQGILISKSKYICYLDDDDKYFSNHLEILVNELSKSKNQFVYTDGYRVSFKIDGSCEKRINKEVYYSLNFDPVLLNQSNYIPVLCMGHQRQCLIYTGLFETELPNLMDWDIWVKSAEKFKFKHIKKITCEYKLRLSNDTLSGNKLDHQFYYYLLKNHHIFTSLKKWNKNKKSVFFNNLNFSEIEKIALNYSINPYCLTIWLYPQAIKKKRWKKAISLLKIFVRTQSLRKIFFVFNKIRSDIYFLGSAIFLIGVIICLIFRLIRYLLRLFNNIWLYAIRIISKIFSNKN